MDNLAIIIPAYRAQDIHKALSSLAAQTDRGFHVYIGDDASPEDLRAEAAEFEDRMAVTYHRFETNLGRTSLSQHINRCLELSREEEYVCLLSDDNELSRHCVARWRRTARRHPEFDVYHWNIEIIGENGQRISRGGRLPRTVQVEGLYKKVLQKGTAISLSSFVFRRTALPPADEGLYRSDLVMVFRAAEMHGIRTVCRARLRWRRHAASLSGNPATEEKVAMSDFQFLLWTETFFSEAHPISEKERMKLLAQYAARLYPSHTYEEIKSLYMQSSLFADGRNKHKGPRTLKRYIKKREEQLRDSGPASRR